MNSVVDELVYDLALSFDQSITPIEKRFLFEKYQSSKNILKIKKSTLKSILGRRWTGKNFDPGEMIEKGKRIIDFIQKSRIKTVRFDQENYPSGLKEIPDYPFLLYYKGDISYEFQKSIAVVGTREPDNFGIERVKIICQNLTKAKYCIISGLAAGIDSGAHLSSLDNNGKTIAVLGCGIDRIYPAFNNQLGRRIVENGGSLISEYPPGIEPYRWNFPRRNRIIVGMSKSVLIIQSPSRSGSLISALLANDYNRDLFVCTPNEKCGMKDGGNIDLILKGAQEVNTFKDIVDN